MNAKTLKILVVVTLVCVLAAFALQKLGDPGAGEPGLPERVVPGLADQLNDIAAIELTGGAGSVSLARSDEEWTVASKDGYPAKFETVKQLLIGLAEFAPRERKTADSERYGRLGLADPGEGSDSLGVKLANADGSTIAEFVLGEQVNSGAKQQRFVRVAGDDQSWLAEGRIDAPTDAVGWLDTSITQIARDRITRVAITHPDGEVVSIAREQGGTNYTLETVPEGRSAKSAAEVGAPTSALAYLRFDDVRAGDSMTDEAGEPVIAVYDTADDLRVTVRTWQLDGKTWASFAAESMAEPAEPGAGPPSDEAAGKRAATPPAEIPADPQAEVDALNSKLTGWLFSIPEYQAKSFRKRLTDLTDEPEPVEDEAAGGRPADGDDEPVFIPTRDAADDPAGGG